MTVFELIAILQTQDQSWEVWLGNEKMQEDDVWWVELLDDKQIIRFARE